MLILWLCHRGMCTTQQHEWGPGVSLMLPVITVTTVAAPCRVWQCWQSLQVPVAAGGQVVAVPLTGAHLRTVYGTTVVCARVNHNRALVAPATQCNSFLCVCMHCAVRLWQQSLPGGALWAQPLCVSWAPICAAWVAVRHGILGRLQSGLIDYGYLLPPCT